MIVYHGTTSGRARRICEDGFLPRKPSRRVWFAESRAYALRRAKTQGRRAHDRPVVLACDIDLNALRARIGAKRLMHKNRVIAINAPVPVSVLRSRPGVDVPTTPEDIARWVNRLLGLKPHKGVGRRHAGVDRLSRWVNNRLQGGARIKPQELLEMAQRWLPEFFENVEVDPEHLRVERRAGSIEVEVDADAVEADPREDEAVECLGDRRAGRRARGLRLLARIRAPNLFDWCVMFLDDTATGVRLAALEAMLECQDAHPEVIEPLAQSGNRRIRAAAIAALACHGGQKAPRWFARGLKDPSPCVRVATARQLGRLDPAVHQSIFKLALYDTNPDVARAARKLTQGKGYAKARW